MTGDRKSNHLPAHWTLPNLKKVATLSGRIGWKGLTAKEYTESGPLFLSVHSLNYGDCVDFRDAFHISQHRYDESPEIMLQSGDVLICKDGAGIGKVGIVDDLPGLATINSSLLLVRAGASVNPKYLYYVLLSPYFQRIVQTRLEGATTPHLYQRDIKEFPARLPPLPEQERIVAILDEAFAAIATAIANAEKNLANAQELFKGYLHLVFARSTSSWSARRLGDVCENLDSMRVPITKSKREAGSVPYYGASGVVDHVADHLFDEDLLLVSEDGANLLARTYPIAFSISGKAWVNNHAHVLRFKHAAHQRHVEYYLNSITLEPYVNGMAQPKLNQKALNSIPIPWSARVSEVEKVVDSLEATERETGALLDLHQQKLALLAELKQSILHKAFTGELTAGIAASAPIRSRAVIEGINTTDLHAAVLAIAYRAHEAKDRLKHFGHVKGEKIAHMVEYHIGINLDRSPVKDAAGPNDYPHLKKVESRAKKAGFFSVRKRDARYELTPLGGFDHLIERASEALGDRLDAVEDLIALMLPMTARQSEILATVYAAWNNLLVDGHDPADDAIVREAREDWHREKLKIPRGRFLKAIKWIRDNDLAPKGVGKKVGKRRRSRE